MSPHDLSGALDRDELIARLQACPPGTKVLIPRARADYWGCVPLAAARSAETNEVAWNDRLGAYTEPTDDDRRDAAGTGLPTVFVLT